MTNKEMLSANIPVIRETIADRLDYNPEPNWRAALKKIWLYLKGTPQERTVASDPAAEVISQIANREIATIVRDLHYKTPRSLMAMRKSCQECFMLPDDCPYYDYSIFDVKKAIKKLAGQPMHIQIETVKELQKINTELAYHLQEYLD
jgi:hypothetical protein